MNARRLSNEALFLVLACLFLGTLVLAQTTLRACTATGVAPGPSACLDAATCAASRHAFRLQPADVGIQDRAVAKALKG